jgi:hypothetical protein
MDPKVLNKVSMDRISTNNETIETEESREEDSSISVS